MGGFEVTRWLCCDEVRRVVWTFGNVKNVVVIST